MITRRTSILPTPPSADSKEHEFIKATSDFSTNTILELEDLRKEVYLDIQNHEESIEQINQSLSNKLESIDLYENNSMITSKKKLNFKSGTWIDVDVSPNGDLGDISISYTGWQNLDVQKNGTLTSSRRKVNFIEGQGITINISDDSSNERTNIQISGPKNPGFCRCVRTATYNLSNDTYWTVQWQQTQVDTDSFWSSGQPTRLTIPSGFTKAIIFASCNFSSASTPSGRREIRIIKNGSTIMNVCLLKPSTATESTADIQATTGIIPVSSGDYFEVSVYQNQGSALAVGGGTSGLNGLFLSVEAFG